MRLPFLPAIFEPPRLNRAILTNAALIAVAFIPLTFGFLDVWANWDPTHHLNKLNAAVVNNDRPITVTLPSGQQMDVAIGRLLAGQLTGSQTNQNYQWESADATDAYSGLKSGHYSAVITIPENFSAAATSASRKDPNPQQAVLHVRTNDAQNYLLGTITSVISSTVTSSVNAQVNQSYLDNLYVGFTDLHKQIKAAATGANQLTDGARQLAVGAAQASAGADQLVVGLGQLASGAVRLSVGADQLHSGASQLSAGTGKLSSGLDLLASKTTDLPSQAAALNSGAQRVAAGAAKLATGNHQADVGTAKLYSGASRLAAKTPALASGAGQVYAGTLLLRRDVEGLYVLCKFSHGEDDTVCQSIAGALDPTSPTGIEALVTGARQVAEGAAAANSAVHEIKAGLRDLKNGTGKLATGADQLAAGARLVADGTAQLAGQAPQLTSGIASAASGAQQIETGAGQLASGSGQIADGASALAGGAVTAHDGAQRLAGGNAALADGNRRLLAGQEKLADGLSSGVSKIPSYTDEQRKQYSAIGAAPVKEDLKRIHQVAAYGAGVAPYFMAFGLWAGAIAIYLLISPLPAEALAMGAVTWRIVAGGLVPGLVMGVVQALIMVFGLQFTVDLDAQSLFGLANFAMLVALVFVMINHAFVALLGGTGRLLSLLFAGLQLAAAGGTYPVQTTPAFFRAVHNLQPITYAVRSFRELIAGGGTHLAQDLIGLLIWGAIALLVSFYAAMRQRNWTVSHLQTVQPA